MKYIPYVLMLLWSVVRSWRYLPMALWQALKTGGLLRWLGLTFSGLRYLQKKGLPPCHAALSGDKIHFLRTGNSDAILLESGGKFALIDAAEDSEYPAEKPGLAAPGWEAYVPDYVKRAAGDAQGKAVLEFVLGTHAHSDHIGGFDTLLADPNITVHKAYLKPYSDEGMRGYEKAYWDNDVVYEQMLDALAQRGIPLEQDIPESLALGNFQLRFYNRKRQRSGDENDNSIGTLVECGGLRAFLAGDINNISGVESQTGKQVGKVDLLKGGHHGHDGSGTLALAAQLRPETVVFTSAGKASKLVLGHFIFAANAKRLLSTGTFGGVMAVFENNAIAYYAINEFAEPLPPQSAEKLD